MLPSKGIGNWVYKKTGPAHMQSTRDPSEQKISTQAKSEGMEKTDVKK